MNTLGRHIIADLWGCNVIKLNNITFIKQQFVAAAIQAGADVREVVFHQFSPYGISGVVIIAESHLTIHSFPEHAYASIDMYTCGTKINPNVAIDYINNVFEAKQLETREIVRGTRPIRWKSEQ